MMDRRIRWLKTFFLTTLFSFAAMPAQAEPIMIHAQSGNEVSLDGVWGFPGCFAADPEDPPEEQFDEREFLVFNGNTVESRVILYSSTDGTCTGVETVESETFPAFAVGEFESPGWGEGGTESPPLCQDPSACPPGGLLDSTPMVTVVNYVLSVDEIEVDHLYIDDTGGTWYLYRDAGEDDEPSEFMSSEEPLLREGPTVISVAIDIKPGSDPNSVNPGSNGVITVAVLGSIDFDATQVDPANVMFGPGGASPAHDGHIMDVNEDGFMDAVFHFRTQETEIACGVTEATLSGGTFDSAPITGTDMVNTIGCKGS